jgi:tRNA modification GTPase
MRGEEANLLLAVVPADAAPDTETMSLLLARPDAFLVTTKCDLAAPPARLAEREAIQTSARTGAGISELRAALAAAAERLAGTAESPLITRSRHRAALQEAAARLLEAESAPFPELASEAYRGAVLALGRLTGRVGVEEVLDIVFGDFCIGK